MIYIHPTNGIKQHVHMLFYVKRKIKVGNTMISVHHLECSRSFRILWALEELGLDYDIHFISVFRTIQHQKH